MSRLLILLLLCAAGAASAQPAERWNRLIGAEAGFAREMTRVDLVIAYTDLADTIAVVMGSMSRADSDARLVAVARQAFSRDVSDAELAAARTQLANAIGAYLQATAQAAAASTRWPGGAPMQAQAQRLLAAIGNSYPRWLQYGLDPAVLLSQIALVNGWARGETTVVNPFAVHLQRVRGVYPDPRVRARVAAAEAPMGFDGKPVAARTLPVPPPTTFASAPVSPPVAPPPVAPPPVSPPPVVPPPVVPPRAAAGCQGFAGTWESNLGIVPLAVSGNRVQGSYSVPGGRIEGTITGNVLDGRWIQSDRWGLLRIGLTPDGQQWSGAWAEANGSGGGPAQGRCVGAAPVAATTQPPPGRFEVDINRPGQDMSSFDLAQPDPNQCLAACRQASGCRAFTYVKPGVQGPRARCWLKNAVPPAVRSNCCISGMP